jgi:hypothetical protein
VSACLSEIERLGQLQSTRNREVQAARDALMLQSSTQQKNHAQHTTNCTKFLHSS